jgi:hypothetical protein
MAWGCFATATDRHVGDAGLQARVACSGAHVLGQFVFGLNRKPQVMIRFSGLDSR